MTAKVIRFYRGTANVGYDHWPRILTKIEIFFNIFKPVVHV